MLYPRKLLGSSCCVQWPAPPTAFSARGCDAARAAQDGRKAAPDGTPSRSARRLGPRPRAGQLVVHLPARALSSATVSASGRGRLPDRPLGARVRARSDPRPPSPDPARSTADHDLFCPVRSQLHVVFYFFMSGQPRIYHATTEYRRGSQGLLRGFAEPRSIYGPAGPLAPQPQQGARA